MAILPPCRQHEERLASLEKIMEDVVSTMTALVDALKDSNANIAGLQAFKDTTDQTYTPGEIDQDHTYFR